MQLQQQQQHHHHHHPHRCTHPPTHYRPLLYSVMPPCASPHHQHAQPPTRPAPSDPAAPLIPHLALVIFLDLAIVACLIIAFFIRSYHFTSTAVITGSVIHFDVSLFNVRVTGVPQSIIPMLQPAAVMKALTSLMKTLDGHSLREFEAIACYGDALFFQWIPTACDGVTLLRVASGILIGCLVASLLTMVLGLALLLCYMLTVKHRHTLLTHRARIMAHLLPGCITILGCLMYILVGGVNLNFIPEVGFISGDTSYFDISTGFFWTLGTGLLSLTTPIILYFVIDPRDCVNAGSKLYPENPLRDSATQKEELYPLTAPYPFFHPR